MEPVGPPDAMLGADVGHGLGSGLGASEHPFGVILPASFHGDLLGDDMADSGGGSFADHGASKVVSCLSRQAAGRVSVPYAVLPVCICYPFRG